MAIRTKIKSAVKSLEQHERAVSIPRVTGIAKPKISKNTRQYKKGSLQDSGEFGFGDTGLTGES